MKSSIYQHLIQTFDMTVPQGKLRTGAKYYLNNRFLQIIKYERASVWAVGFNKASCIYLIKGLKMERFI